MSLSAGTVWRQHRMSIPAFLAGSVDVYLHGGQKLWDYAAGSLILEEAGGFMCTLDQEDFWADTLWKRSAIAAREARLFEAWKRWIRARQ